MATVVAGLSMSLDGIQQVLNARLLDELTIELVPVLLGEGIRFFDNLTDPPMMFENPTIIEGDQVTHLIYRRSGEPRSTDSIEALPVGW